MPEPASPPLRAPRRGAGRAAAGLRRMPPRARTDAAALARIKLVHTLVWAGFAACILVLPLASWQGRHRLAAGLAAVVAVEALVLACNRMRCPLTAVAARHTEDRRANFDIHLPEALARNNQLIFGGLYLGGLLFAAVHWARPGARTAAALGAAAVAALAVAVAAALQRRRPPSGPRAIAAAANRARRLRWWIRRGVPPSSGRREDP